MKTKFCKSIRIILLLAISAASSLSLFSQTIPLLKFKKDGTFKIAQFTDIHWDNNSPKCTQTVETIRQVLAAEKPNMAVLTGDIVTAVPAQEGWLAICKIFADAKMPFAVTLGNHDAEPDVTRNQIFELLKGKPFFVGEKGPELYGCGNYALAIKSSDGKSVAAVVYCLDSNDYPKNKRIGHYDWIQFNQIDWYRKTSDRFTASNRQSPLPSLAFFHIPLLEFNNLVNKESTLGSKNEEVASSEINSGLFASMVEKKDVMGVFVGHDHDNDFIGITHDIALAFGRVTGADAYGDFERGSRIIELQEGEFSFNSWIRTASGVKFPYNYPSGMSIDTTNLQFSKAQQVTGLKPGVSYNYYEGDFKSTSELAATKVKMSGILKNISIETAVVKDSFALAFHAWLKIPKRGLYSFYTYSDDGSKLFIDGKEVVNNDNSHGLQRADGKIALDEGFHEFKLLYFENYMGQELEVGFSSLGIRECKIPDQFFYTKGS
jgi:hypothetical protein